MRCEYLRIGIVVRPHGVRGAVKLMSLSSVDSRFATLRSAFIELGENEYTPIKVVSASSSSDGSVTMCIDGVESRDDAEKLRGKYICVDRMHAAPLPEGQYYVADLIGCTVSCSDGTVLGTLDDIYETGANDVYVVKCTDGRTLSAPVIKKLLHSVDIEGASIIFDKEVLDEVGFFDD